MKVIVSFSGGKDSLASLLWVRNNLTKDFITVFCDTGWEHPLTYKYIEEVQEQLGLNLITVKSKKFNGMVDLTKKKSRWPSSQRRFCTSELKTIPMIDYILDEVNDDVLIIQGIRAAESAKRAEMSKQCTYFKYYVQPYGKDKNGKDKYHTYRRKDVLAFRKKYADDLLRPVFDWSAQQVIDYILENGIQPNPLYRMGYKRVGCFPCVMASQQDIYNISVQEPERISYIAGLEQQFNSSFFGPDKISSKYYKGEYPLLCFHPRNTNYVILLNHCEEPERFFIQNLIDRFYTNYTSRDIITYRRDYAIKKLKEFEQALSELGDKDEL
jgi:3'-phosphoadenosine 5'-phosphosulfate sulfotransferase (PAPS reductase)/FAD synthetase